MAKYYDGRKAKFKETIIMKNGEKIQRAIRVDKNGYNYVTYNRGYVYVRRCGGVWWQD